VKSRKQIGLPERKSGIAQTKMDRRTLRREADIRAQFGGYGSDDAAL
jgi:hypothetical protein